MQIYVLRDNQQTGPFTESQVRGELAAGTITPDTFVWWEGLPEWKPLGQTSLLTAPTPPVPAPPHVASPSEFATPAPHVLPERWKSTPPLAVVSLTTGILGFICCPIPGLVAVVTGHLARREIRRNPMLKGGGMALAGLVLGYVWIALFLIYLPFAAALQKNVHETFLRIQQEQQQKLGH